MPTIEPGIENNGGHAINPQPTQTVYIQSAKPHPIWWVIAGSLAVIAVAMVLRPDGGIGQPAFAQSTMSASAHGIFAFSGQVSKNAYGVFMVDTDAGTIWCYRIDPNSGKLQLVSGRFWRHDSRLENWGTEPSTKVIEEILEEQRLAKQKASGQP
ncbi:MAG TPA: hypothetical protein PKN33_08225 [Phycisphaerae bacterium]|nr:hypothetical protein [Phycisphaerales bacterium]HNO78034.1 hypothetical protein [Phycisphaerae bacterium]